MKTAIVKASDLGECWSALKHTGECHRCDKYEVRYKDENGNVQVKRCPYRTVNHEYDALLAEERRTKEKLDYIRDQIHRVRGEQP